MELRLLAEEQAALRRVATLVAQQPSPEEVFDAVTEEVGRLLEADLSAMHVYPGDGTATTISGWSETGDIVPIGTKLPLEGESVAGEVFRTAAPARMDSYDDVAGGAAEVARGLHLRSTIGAPIVIDGQLWGTLVAATRGEEPFPAGAEAQIGAFTDLVATAVSNADARRRIEFLASDLRRLADEQTALRHVATLVAKNATAAEVLNGIAVEVGRVIGVADVMIERFEEGVTVMVAALDEESWPVGSRWPLDGPSTSARVFETGRPARIDDYEGLPGTIADGVRRSPMRSSVGVPIVVDGRPWGVMCVGVRHEDPLPADTEERLSEFTDLLATSISNAEATEALTQLADEQAALRRVATLVAQDVPPAEVFAAVTREVARVFAGLADPLVATVIRFDPGPESVLVGASRSYESEPVGSRWEPRDLYVSTRVLRTGRPARVTDEDLEAVGGPDADVLRRRRFHYQVGVPVVVEGRVWGAMTLNSSEALPPGTDESLEKFTELIATAISNADARDSQRALADEQAALRRVATLVASGADASTLFDAVCQEAAMLLDASTVNLSHYTPDGFNVTMAGWSLRNTHVRPGATFPLTPDTVGGQIVRTRAPVRVEDWSGATSELGRLVARQGLRSSVGAPVLVEGELWGALVAATDREEPLPSDTEWRLGTFAELIATAIANADSRAGLRRLAAEQAALRRLATLVAVRTPPMDFYAAVAEEVAQVLEVTSVNLVRYDPDRRMTVLASFNNPPFPAGSSWPLEGRSVTSEVLDTADSVRIDDYSELRGPIAETTRDSVIASSVGVPIVVEGRVWGMLAVGGTEPLREGIESRLREFTELVATSISNTEARDALSTLADEQASLRRVATLVAEGASPSELFAAVADEVASVLGVSSASVSRFIGGGVSVVLASLNDPGFPVGSRWTADEGTMNAAILATGKPVRIDQEDMAGPIADASLVSDVRSVVGVPIMVQSRVWGMVAVGRQHSNEPLPVDTEARLTDFTELIATAISNTEARDGERRLAEEQAALRRVATLVAEGAAPTELFSAVSREVEQLFSLRLDTADVAGVIKIDPGPEFVLLGASRHIESTPLGTRWSPKDVYASTRVLLTGRPARVDAHELEASGGPDADFLREQGFLSQVASPVVVEGELWGVVTMNSAEALPADAEDRLEKFTELVATAVANAESRDAVARLAGEQAALRRVATLVAAAAPASQLFAAVADEVAFVTGAPWVSVSQYGPDRSFTVLASGNPAFDVGSRWQLDGRSLAQTIHDTGRSARIDSFADLPGPVAAAARTLDIHSAMGAPIVVDGAVWGYISVAASSADPLSPETERRLQDFTELVATAISNTDARNAVGRLADEQASLRRVATLVARGASPDDLFTAVIEEIKLVLGVGLVSLDRYEHGASAVVLASTEPTTFPVGSRWPLEDSLLRRQMYETRRSTRVDDFGPAKGTIASALGALGISSAVGAPIIVEGAPWGCLVVATTEDEPFPADTEERLARFTELVATAVTNATTRAELMASRARLVTAGDEARRRIERNLHDGTQQRLVTIDLGLRAVESRIDPDNVEALERLQRIRDDLHGALDEVREVSRGLHPSGLAEAGLAASLRSLARRSGIGVQFEIDLPERPPEAVEIGAYYLVSEALTNTVKHAQASSVTVQIAEDGGALRVAVADDGAGGARVTRGSGLEGLVDRVEALGGRLEVDSPPGRGTRLLAVFPLLEVGDEAPPPDSEPPASIEAHLDAVAAAARVLEIVGRDGALYVVDRAGRIDFMDDLGHRLLGYAAGELRGKPAHDAIHYLRPDGSPFPAADCPLLRPWLTGEAVTVDEDWFVAKDGSFVPVAYTAAPLPLPGARATVIGFRVR